MSHPEGCGRRYSRPDFNAAGTALNEREVNHGSSVEEVGGPSPKAQAQVQSHISEALVHFAGGRISAAEHCLNKTQLLVPDHPDVLHLLGLAAKQRGDQLKAVELIERALDRLPGHPVFHNNLGNILLDAGEPEAAINHYRQAIDSEPAYVDAQFNLGIALERQGKSREAIACYRATLILNPGYVDARHNLGVTLESLGHVEDAVAEYRKAIATSPDYARAYYRIASAAPEMLDEAERLAMEALQSNLDPAGDAAIHLHFGLASAYAEVGRSDDAITQWKRGNRKKRATFSYDVADSTQFHVRIADQFTPELFNTRGGQGHDDDKPIFVVGMPRSGTTLVEQILASHPRVSAAGELTVLGDIIRKTANNLDAGTYPEIVRTLDEEYLHSAALEYVRQLRTHAPSASHVVDKMPGNFLYVGMIKLMLPNARIIHCVRDPVATCFSCYTQLFNSPQRFTYDLTELGTYYSSYRRLMAHWHQVLPGEIFDLHYEDLVADQETLTRRLLEFCALDWDETCLAFHETQRPVRTASATQVRKPIYKSALTGWREYDGCLVPLLKALG